MYAIIRAGGKQAKVQSGDVIEVERLKDAGDTVEFRPLLIVEDDGTTHSDASALSDAKVTAKVLGEVKGDKIDIFKYKNKTGYRRRGGHRQTYTQVEITAIDLKPKKARSTSKKSTASKAKEEAASTPEAASEEE
jgi:large subunit ribosomal protein L21